MKYVFLSLAIISEVIATSALKASSGFTKPWSSLIVIVGYGIAFYCLSRTLQFFPVGIVYAIWSGVGIALISIIGWFWFKQHLDVPALIGIFLITAGVLVVNLFSKTAHS